MIGPSSSLTQWLTGQSWTRTISGSIILLRSVCLSAVAECTYIILLLPYLLYIFQSFESFVYLFIVYLYQLQTVYIILFCIQLYQSSELRDVYPCELTTNLRVPLDDLQTFLKRIHMPAVDRWYGHWWVVDHKTAIDRWYGHWRIVVHMPAVDWWYSSPSLITITYRHFHYHRENCNKRAARALRPFYRRPYFMPHMVDFSDTNWVIMSSDYKAKVYKEVGWLLCVVQG